MKRLFLDLSRTGKGLKIAYSKPVFVISDLHIGDGSQKDNLSRENREELLSNFLEYVQGENGELIIIGDFIELWPWRPLYFDIVPGKQRGRGVVINRYASIAARFIFMYFLIGSFDMNMGQKKLLNGMTSDKFAGITGEQLIYFSAAALVLLSLVLILFLVKEKKDIQPAGERFSLIVYLKEMFATRNNFYMCLLVICYVHMSTRLASLRPLLITDQFGYSKKKIMGHINVVTMIFSTTLFLPIIAIFVDKLNHFRIFIIGMIFSTIHPSVYWVYVKFFTSGGIPAVPVIIAFNVADSIFDRTAMLVL